MSQTKAQLIEGTSSQDITLGQLTASTAAGGFLASTSEVNGTSTTGTITSGTASLIVASATGITSGMYVAGEGIAPGTTVTNVVGTTVTLSANANATLSSDPVTFYVANKVLTPGVVGGQLCKAWVNFNGIGTVAIRASYNVSSITDNGIGNYTVNFTTAMPDANYCAVYGTQANALGRTTEYIVGFDGGPYSTTALGIEIWADNGSNYDVPVANVAIFR